MMKEEYIDNHLLTCNAIPCKKYDNDKKTNSYHSLEYSRRKCAKKCYKQYIKCKE